MCSDCGRLYNALLGQHLPTGDSETCRHTHALTHTHSIIKTYANSHINTHLLSNLRLGPESCNLIDIHSIVHRAPPSSHIERNTDT